ncbi:NAD(P)/FAD-dependent oxidoreductase [Janibacter cremeus]|uniref:dihydrolipoyl dehydrogenase family protein n=1 Tax=Janibacter cremeus TaxID=1285192 RepID=UPI0023F94A64|nr:NAD(P)/FAD-dependent oxidoreductase [Janibacter cremeus]WEV77246.1 NAD(P)/FAD-dependent oxidoreductase [Janibacter cremeus]
MTTPTDEPETVDVIVLGGGPVGENLAQYAIEDSDLTAAIVEVERYGGECSYWACIPSKALLRPAQVATTSAHLQGLVPTDVDREALLARRDEWVSHYDDSGQAEWVEGAGIRPLRGHGRLVGEREIEVEGEGEGGALRCDEGASKGGTRRLRARRAVVIATGSEPVIPPPFREALPWGSRDATGVREVPDRIVIVGGGVVACEAATWMAALGARVTMLVRGPGLLGRMEPFAGEVVTDSLRAKGVDVRLSTEATECGRPEARDTGIGRVHGGPVRLTTGSGTIEADEVLVATGRRPRLGDVGLDAVGLTEDDVTAGHLPEWLTVVGDAGGGPPLTHWGKYRARVVGARIAAEADGSPTEPDPDGVPVPQVVFTDPQVASVGMTARAAEEAGHDVVTSEVPFGGAAGGALLRDDASGRMSIVVDRATGRLLGATFVGTEAGELLHAATIAIVGRVPVHLLRHAVPAFPTASELWLRLLEQLPRDLRRAQVPDSSPA